MSDKPIMSQAPAQPKKSPIVRPGFIAILSALFLAGGITAAVIFWVIPAVEKYEQDSLYDIVGGFAETPEQEDPRVTAAYDNLFSAIEASPTDITSVLINPYADRGVISNKKPAPDKEVGFGISTEVHYANPQDVNAAFPALQQIYLDQGYVIDNEVVASDWDENDGYKSIRLTKENGTDPAKTYDYVVLSRSTNPEKVQYNFIGIDPSISSETDSITLEGVPPLSGNLTRGEAQNMDFKGNPDCSETTIDGRILPGFNGAWLEGYGCIEDYA